VQRVSGIALVGAGTIAAAAGAYYAIDDAHAHSDTTTPDIVLGVGLAAAVGGGLLLFFATDSSPPPAAPSTGAAHVSLTPVLGREKTALVATFLF
jgi:hypothetical protein